MATPNEKTGVITWSRLVKFSTEAAIIMTFVSAFGVPLWYLNVSLPMSQQQRQIEKIEVRLDETQKQNTEISKNVAVMTEQLKFIGQNVTEIKEYTKPGGPLR
ncbi:MAG: hypothetical protein IV090_24715 [Candidatus Sericytochromatia bacterium]|nr:hypothetical protein [Candidatus Sericytochromatia bacterium]